MVVISTVTKYKMLLSLWKWTSCTFVSPTNAAQFTNWRTNRNEFGYRRDDTSKFVNMYNHLLILAVKRERGEEIAKHTACNNWKYVCSMQKWGGRPGRFSQIHDVRLMEGKHRRSGAHAHSTQTCHSHHALSCALGLTSTLGPEYIAVELDSVD